MRLTGIDELSATPFQLPPIEAIASALGIAAARGSAYLIPL